MHTQKEINSFKKTVTIPGNIFRFSIGTSLLSLLFFLYTANMTSIKFFNALITFLVLVAVISWADKSENLQDIVIRQLIRTKGNSNVFMVKRKLNLNSILLSASITTGFCFTDSLMLTIKLTLMIVLSLLLVVKVYTGMISNYLIKMLVSKN